MRDASPEVPVVAVSWVCSVVACAVRNAEQARLNSTGNKAIFAIEERPLLLRSEWGLASSVLKVGKLALPSIRSSYLVGGKYAVEHRESEHHADRQHGHASSYRLACGAPVLDRKRLMHYSP